MTPTIFIIEDDIVMAECIQRALPHSYQSVIFTNVLEALEALAKQIPALIMMDILLNGPNGLSLLNELSSYSDTNQIPVIVLTYLDLQSSSLAAYNVAQILDKATMTPQLIHAAAQQALKLPQGA